MEKTKAFTMAEVLITLGILGVVIAMTLPLIVSKYKRLVFEVAFKKQYSVIQNTINYITATNGYYNCYVTHPNNSESYVSKLDDCETLKADLIEKLNLKKLDDSILDEYATSDAVKAQGGVVVNQNCNVKTIYSEPYITNDGTLIYIGIKGMLPGIILDVNGEKKPNKWGYDVFWLNFSNRFEDKNITNILLTDEYCSLAEKGGRLPRTILGNMSKNQDNIKWEW